MDNSKSFYKADLERYKKGGGYTRYLILWTYLFRKAQGTRNPFF